MKCIIVGGDHISVELKASVLRFLDQSGFIARDAGADSADIVVDYPLYAQIVGKAVASGEFDGGIVICGTGVGASIAANKIPGVRAALCHDVFTAHQARAHNDANVLALGAWVVSPEQAPAIVEEWLNTPFEGGRHIARLKMLDQSFDHTPISSLVPFNPSAFSYSVSISIKETFFGPVLFMGQAMEGFKCLAENGFKSVELSIRNAEDINPDELSNALDQNGLRVSALATGQGCLHDHLCLTSRDAGIHTKVVLGFKNLIDLAGGLNTGIIMGGARGKLVGSEQEMADQRKIGVESIAECAAYAEKVGVPFFIEPINRYETNFINTAFEALELIDEIGVQSAQILLDTFHMNIEEVDIQTTLRQVGGKLAYVHIADSNRQAPGQGHLDLKGFLSSLYQTGYRGVVSAEILPQPDSWSAVKRTSNFLTSLGVGINPRVSVS